jgi:hypothetical protein
VWRNAVQDFTSHPIIHPRLPLEKEYGILAPVTD